MKIKIVFALSLCLLGSLTRAQSPKEERAQKMMDSIMENMPADQQQFMKQMMQMGKEADQRRAEERKEAQSAREVKNREAQRKSEDEFYWRNTIASNTQGKFSNWSWGKADIKVRFDKTRNRTVKFLKVGEVSAGGQVTLMLPKIDYTQWPSSPITKVDNEGDRMWAYQESLEFSNTEVTYFSTRFTLDVYQAEKRLGNLKIGNAIRPVVNLNAPCCFDKAGDGYTAHWMYMSQAHRIKGTSRMDPGNGEQGEIVHNLTFQPGWNLVKVRVEGSKKKAVNGTSGSFWKNKYYTVATTLPSDAKYYFISSVNK